ncbi:MAG: hypothetical protein R3F35_14610 [Myxococcota bacterium]
MSPPPQPIECAGHPRDMGLAQGRALRAAIRAAVAGAGLPRRRARWPSLRPLVSGPLRGRGAGRELFRHFAHQAERLEGLAEGAEVPLDSVLELQLRMRSGDGGPGAIVRASRPVVGFRSLEVTWPWLVPAVAGVNEAGLAVLARTPVAVHGGDPAIHREGGAPPLLLVQDCLARFEDLAGALDWCRKRPVEGEQTLVLADASGAMAEVVVSGRMRRIVPAVSASRSESGAVEGGASSQRLGRELDAERGVGVRLDPIGRALWLDPPIGAEEGAPRRFALAATN